MYPQHTTLSAVALAAGACTDEPSSRRTLEASGFSDVTFQGQGYFVCAQDDAFSTKFPKGQTISAMVRVIQKASLAKVESRMGVSREHTPGNRHHELSEKPASLEILLLPRPW